MERLLSALPIVAFDEAGNTGQNLLDDAQPVFVAASVTMTDEEARAVLAKAIPPGATEAKFTKLRRSAPGRERLIAFFEHPLLSDERVKTSVYHKRFMITTKIVDLLVEPLAYRSNVDLYEGAANLGLANLWHHVITSFCGRENFDELLRRFVVMVRAVTPENVDRFYRHVEHLRSVNSHPPFDADLTMILASEDIVYELLDASDEVALDPAVPAFVELAAQWSASLGVPFRLVHDRSKPIEHEQEMLERLMSLSEPGRVFTNYGPSWRLPLLANQIEFVDSHSVPQVQVADLVAGAAMMTLSGRARGEHTELTRRLMETNFAELSFSQVWPTLAVTPSELHADERPGSASLNYLIEVSRRGRERARR